MTEDEVQCERRKRLAGWVSEHGGASTVCHKRGLPKATESYISQILGGYSFGARVRATAWAVWVLNTRRFIPPWPPSHIHRVRPESPSRLFPAVARGVQSQKGRTPPHCYTTEVSD